jgi:hypothetical protein
MIKDASKYAATEGWGFGRWKGVDHVPYGKDASFTSECTSCHAPMRDNDFVFTMPITNQAETSDFFNRTATLLGDLPYQPLQWRVITSSVDKAKSTMSTLYGNDAAVTQARTSPAEAYPPGAVLCLVTWQQQEDRHWFGGRIPGPLQSVEFVTAGASSVTQPAYSYQAYEGTPLTKVPAVDPATTQARIDAIVGQRASVMP